MTDAQTFTKPCARADRGCPGMISRKRAHDLRRAIYCGRACSMRARLERGYAPWLVVSAEAHRRGGRLGGLIANQRRRQRRRAAILARLERAIPHDLRHGMTHRQLTAVRALMSLAFQQGQAIERKRLKDAKTIARRKAA